MLFPIDKNGCVINEASDSEVQEQYKPAIQELLAISKIRLEENFRSFYVRGSVSVGRAIPDISDLDVVIFVNKEIQADYIAWFSDQAKQLEKKYFFITFVDITVITLERLLNSIEYSNLKIYLKTQSFCVEGEEMLHFLPEVIPGRSLAISMYGQNLINELNNLRSVINGEVIRKYHDEEKPLEFWCIWIMRVLLRSGLGLVMISKPVYSQDLKTCAEVFCEKYPQYSKDIQKALEYAINPVSDKKELASFFDNFVPQYIKLWEQFTN